MSEKTIDEVIFDYFNDKYPDEMQEVIGEYNEENLNGE